MRPKQLTILDAFDDPALFGSMLRKPVTWRAWRGFLAALFALPMTQTEAALYRECTGRSKYPADAFSEAWLVCGRRAGKSFILAMIAVFLACFRTWQPYLGPGERAMILVIATDRRQARVIFRYVRALLSMPMLSQLVDHEASEILDLTNGVSIEIGIASYRTTRGYTLAAVLCDELAFWRTDDSAEPDYEILDALRPGLGTLPGTMLLCASSPYAQTGALYDAYRRYHGRDDAPVLIWHAATRTMNPTFPQATIDQALERDSAAAGAEYLAVFRQDVEAFVSREVVESAIIPGRFELPPSNGTAYFAFVDPSGGSSDSMTLAIAHSDNGRAVLDVIRERRSPFSPDDVVAEFSATLKAYHIAIVHGDHYAGLWPRERFQIHGVTYEVSDKTKSTIYLELLPLLNARRVELLDVPRLMSQLGALERRTARGGRDSIDHRPGAHDDAANAVAGALVLALGAQPLRFTPEMVAQVLSAPRYRVDGLPPHLHENRQSFLGERLEAQLRQFRRYY
jgi:hypothetical protein